MDYLRQIEEYRPGNEQEERDKRIILDYARRFPDNILLRSNETAHFTASGFILNPSLDRVLLVHHNLRNVWAWTGGHADGEADLLKTAVKEAVEETGIGKVKPLFSQIASLDILTVAAHRRKGEYVNAHLHFSAGYILICGEEEELKVCQGENSAVEWFPLSVFTEDRFSAWDVYLYQKLADRAVRHGSGPERPAI